MLLSSSFTDGETEAGRGEVFIKIENGLCYLWDGNSHLSHLIMLQPNKLFCSSHLPPSFPHHQQLPTSGLLPMLFPLRGQRGCCLFYTQSSALISFPQRGFLSTPTRSAPVSLPCFILWTTLFRLKLSSLLVYLVYYLSGTEVGQLWAMGQILPVG